MSLLLLLYINNIYKEKNFVISCNTSILESLFVLFCFPELNSADKVWNVLRIKYSAKRFFPNSDVVMKQAAPACQK
jgi:hypothetical protein